MKIKKTERKLFNKRFLNAIVVIASGISLIAASGCMNRYESLDLSMYHYRDTRDLVKFVYDASLILKHDGLKSLPYFNQNRELYNTPDYYLYIYEMDGTNIYHAGMENLQGECLREITDKNGKKITRLILGALENKHNPHAWVHYSWWESGKFYPVPKSSCHFKVKIPEGRELFIGGGLNYPHEEQEFIRIIVDDAVELIEKNGADILPHIADPVSRFNYRDVRVFAFRADGELLISPAINSHFTQTNLIECSDDVGEQPFIKAMKKLEIQQSTWEVFVVKNRDQRVPVKKCLYIRKTFLEDQNLFVGAITDLPRPPY